jgi:hypothetical protein
MATQRSKSIHTNLEIGAVFTPLQWGEFAIDQFGVFEKWMAGATVFDPTMGSGDLLEALVKTGLRKGFSIEELPLKSLHGNELNTVFHKQAVQKFEEEYGVDMRNNFENEDFLKLGALAYDIILGNPPWANFNDLPTAYKEEIKEHFFTYDLVKSGQKLLLGGSRIDLAALIIQRAILDFLQDSGDAYFFMPLSLLLNDGANEQFRTYSIGKVSFAPLKVYDFGSSQIFQGVATRYGLVHFKRDILPSFPIDYKLYEGNAWSQLRARPLLAPTDPLSVLKLNEMSPLDGFDFIELPKFSSPRQGVNTCGANAIYFFTSYKKLDASTCLLNETIKLPIECVHPLLVGANFNETVLIPKKWVVLPYARTGKALTLEEIQEIPLLWDYFSKHKKVLISRKGSMIGAAIKRGNWWAMLGVGPYNFANSKVVWEAYGKSTFKPRLIIGNWQVNQSLQAYIPALNQDEAERIHKKLSNSAIESYLLSLKMEGTMNWAQPGKIKKLIRFID